MAQMTAFEQLALELVNRARLDPLAEAQRFGIDLNAGLAPATLNGTAKQVLAPNQLILDAARAHSAWMNATDIFSHTGAGNSSFDQRMASAGYAPPNSFGGAENIAFNGTSGTVDHLAFTLANHEGLFESAGHRVNILEGGYREAGFGEHLGQFTQEGTTFNSLMLTQNFGIKDDLVFVTGVAFDDLDADRFYDVGEARGGVSVSVVSNSASALGSAVGEAAGGYAVRFAAQSAVVTFSGAGLAASVTATVNATSGNVKLDLVGADTLHASGHVTLGAGAKNALLLGVADLNATGNGLDNVLDGNKGKNTLIGGSGADVLKGFDGDDILEGGAGIDTYVGGLGNDAYYVHNLGSNGRVEDVFQELANQGIDGVNTSVTLNLNEARYANIENGYIVGNAVTNLGGSAVANVLVGNNAANAIYGLGGRDILRGEGGADVFHYLNGGETGRTAATRDIIQDFTSGTDKINLSVIDANGALAGNGTFQFLAGAGTAFSGVAGQLRYVQENPVNTVNDKTIIEGDVNGDRVADLQIELTGLKTLLAADFVL